MQRAAQEIVSKYGGIFPTTFDQVLALPGVGRYTAGAILSIALDQRWPILEGNTQRVHSRLMGLQVSPKQSQANALLWEFATAILPRRGSGILNQALMELGALVCTPTASKCPECPLRRYCAAYRRGQQSSIPVKQAPLNYEDRTEFAFVIQNKSRQYLVRPIPTGRRWAGLWDFPRTSEQPLQTMDEAVQWLARVEGISLVPGNEVMRLKHAVTRFRIQLMVYRAVLVDTESPPILPWGWRSLAELSTLPLSRSGREIVQKLESQGRV
jgi:A/G-specific adenine glycosylase